MYEDNTKKIKRAAYAVIAVVICLVLYAIFNRGSLTITIPEQGNITINNDEGTVAKKEDTKKIHSFLRPGTYKVTVENEAGDKTSVSVIKIRALQSKNQKISLAEKIESYRLINKATSNVYAINPSMYIGIDLERGAVKSFDNAGSYDLTYPDIDNIPINFNSLQKLDEDYYLATSRQTPPLLIQVSGSSVFGNVVHPPGSNEGDNVLTARTSNGKSFWVVSKDTAYLFSYPYVKPSKTVKVQNDSSYSDIVASNDKILFYTAAEAVADDPDKKIEITKPVIFDAKTKRKTSIDYNIVSASWSPDGAYIGLIGSESKYLSLYHVADGKITENIDQPDIPSVYWKNPTELFYAKDNQLWNYSLNNLTAHSFADIEDTPTSITFSNDQILTTSYPDAPSATVWTIPLGEPDENLVRLNSVLPYLTTDYNIDYSFVGSPLITVRLTAPNNGTTPGRIALYNLRTAEAKQKAVQKLSDFGLSNILTNFITQ